MRNECELQPCLARSQLEGVPYVCEDLLGYFRCVREDSNLTTAGPTTPGARVDPKHELEKTISAVLISVAGVLALVVVVVAVIKGAKGNKIIVQKTYYPPGWHDIIKNIIGGGRKRRRDEPAGQYEMGFEIK